MTDPSGKRFRGIILPVLVIILLTAMLSAICMGRYPITVIDALKVLFSKLFSVEQTWPPIYNTLIFKVRLPRVLATVFVGAALAVAGGVYQSVFQNPLVSPDLLGVSSGACVGAGISILLGFSFIYTEGFAFLGGITAVLLTTLLPRILHNRSNVILLLSGIIVSGLMSSIMGTIKYFADPDSVLAAITYWQMGSFSGLHIPSLYITLPVMAVCMIILLLLGWQLNAMSVGEETARSLGINVNLIRGITIVCSTLLTASSVCMCGTIGWVGLVIPHVSRMIMGSNNKKMLPAAICIGAIFMLIVDTLSRGPAAAEVPISILTGFIGTPYFAFILYRQNKKKSAS